MCDPDEYDPWFIQQIQDIPPDKLITLVPERGKVVCLHRDDLLHFFDGDWIWGDCRQKVYDQKGRWHLEDCRKKFNKHPTTNQYLQGQILDIMRDNPRIKVWTTDDPGVRENLGRHIHYVGEVNLDDEVIYRLCPQGWPNSACDDLYEEYMPTEGLDENSDLEDEDDTEPDTESDEEEEKLELGESDVDTEPESEEGYDLRGLEESDVDTDPESEDLSIYALADRAIQLSGINMD